MIYLNDTRNFILGLMAWIFVSVSLIIGASYAFDIENTKPLPEPSAQQVSFSGTINRLTVADLNTLANKPLYSSNDVTCLARNIYFEARNESVLGQHMVAWTTLNRVKHQKWPNTVCKVVYQRKQFSWTIKHSKRKTYNREAYRRAVLIAKDTLEEFYAGGKDLSNGALYYHADYVKPIWRHKLVQIAQVDTHIFYKYPKEK